MGTVLSYSQGQMFLNMVGWLSNAWGLGRQGCLPILVECSGGPRGWGQVEKIDSKA